MSTYWPILTVAVSTVFYHICAKLTPKGLNPLASIIVTYLTGALVSLIIFLSLFKDSGLLNEFKSVSWTTFVFGFAIVGLEVGNIYMYKVGWNINTGYLVESSIIAVALMFTGRLLFNEQLTYTKLIGIFMCLAGLYFINKQ